MALAEHRDVLAAVRALEVAVVLHHAEQRDVHHLRHLDRLAHDHGNQILRRGDDQDAVHRQGLEHGQRHVARAGRHIDEQEVHVVPNHVRPELLDRLRNDRAAVDDRVVLIGQDKVDRDHLHAALAARGQDAFFAALELVMHAESLGDGRAGDIRVQHAAGVALAGHADRQHRGEQAFAHAALAGYHADHFFYRCSGVCRDFQAFFAAAARRAGIAVVRATHSKQLLTYLFSPVFSIPHSACFRKGAPLPLF